MKIRYKLVRSEEFEKLVTENAELKKNLAESISFIADLKNGNYVGNFKDGDSNNVLIKALTELRTSLLQIAQKEKEEKWTTEGLAKFMEILRSDNHDIRKLSENIISNLVKYVDANQGALFILNDSDKNNSYLEMLACYAYGRKKHTEKRIEIGQGLVGQAYLEKQTLFMTQVPNGYTHITSGLGEATPGCVLIVPLVINEQVMAVVELASFHKFGNHQIKFIEKLGESVASTIAAAKISERTAELLKASQHQAEELRAQEEEMRQNVEELTATQEAQARLERELKLRLDELEEAKREIEQVRIAEAEKMKKQNEVQAKIMNATLEKFKKRESELLQQLEAKNQELQKYTEPTAKA